MLKRVLNKVVRMFVVLTILVSIGVVFVPPSPAKADTTTYNHIIPFTITDTSGVARTNLPVVVTYDVSGNLVAYALTNASATDTYMSSIGASNSGVGTSGLSVTSSNFMMSSGNVTFVIPSLPAFGSITMSLYTGYAPAQSSFPIIVGNTGNITTAEAVALRPGNNFSLETLGYIDTTAGSNKNIVNKANAITLAVSPSVSGNITATIGAAYSANVSANSSQYIVQGGAGGTTRAGERFTTWYSPTITSVSFYLHLFGAPTGTANITIRDSGTDAIIGIIGTQDVSLLGAGYAWYTYTGSVNVNTSDIRVMFEYSGGGGGIDAVYVGVDGGGSLSNAVATSYVAGYADNAGTDANIAIVGTTSAIVSVAGITSGVHTATLQADGTNFWLTVDSTVSSNVSVATVPVNATAWYFNQYNVMPYMTYLKETVSGVEVLWYQPTAMISTSTLVNRDSGGSYPGTINWGANSNITISGESRMDSISATSVGTTSVMMQGNLFSLGTYAAVYLSFQYGLDTNYGYTTSESSVAAPQTLSVTLTGLTPNTTYHYRAVARNGIVFAYGADTTVTTAFSTSSLGSTTPLIISVGVFQSYITTGDWLFTAEIVNTYPPFYPTGNPASYFQVQLVGTDGSTLIGTSPLTQWGDRPESIYLSPTGNVTYGAAYQLRVTSISSNVTSTTSHTIVATEWFGDNLTMLDQWCRGVATSMQNTDGTILTNPYLTTLTDYGVVITSAAGGFFTTGIPNIAQVRPNLFSTAKRNNTMPTLSSSITYNAGTTMQGRIGATMTNDAATVGAVLGLTGQQFLLYSIMGVILIFIMYTVASTGGFGALGALCLSVPILGASAYFNILDIIIPVMLAVVFSFLFVRQFIWKTL